MNNATPVEKLKYLPENVSVVFLSLIIGSLIIVSKVLVELAYPKLPAINGFALPLVLKRYPA